MHRFFVVLFETLMKGILSLPRFRIFCALKKWMLQLVGAKIGKRVDIYPRTWIINGKNLVIGDDVDIALGVIITTVGGVEIGDRTLIGYNTQILSSDHEIPPIGHPFPNSGKKYGKITIANDVWIAAGCIITAGVSIGTGAVIGAGSVVTKDVLENTIVAGVPARVIGVRKPPENES